MKYILMIIASICFIGCLTPQKATDYLKKKDKLDDVCAENFPVKDSLIKGDTTIVTDTLINTDTLETFEVIRDTVHHTVTLPAKVITKTKVVTDTIIRQDNAKINALQDDIRARDKTIGDRDNEITKLKSDYEDMKGKRNKLRWWLYIIAGAAGLYIALKVKKIIPF
jgi:hypothetical protein